MSRLQARTQVPPFRRAVLEPLCRCIAATADGLTGSEIGGLLAECQIEEIHPPLTKWRRLLAAFEHFQAQHQTGIHVVRFLNLAMDPARYASDPAAFTRRREQLNPILSAAGVTIGEDGRIRRVPATAAADEAPARAERMKQLLGPRGTHTEVLRCCEADIVREQVADAVLEAMKGVSTRLRQLSGVQADGTLLVDRALKAQRGRLPLVCINPHDTPARRAEQRGIASLLKGLYGLIGKPLAHDAGIEWEMTEQDAADVLTMISLVHRRLDEAAAAAGPAASP